MLNKMKPQKIKSEILLVLMIITVGVLGISIISAAETFQGGLTQSFSGEYRVYGSSVNPQFNNPNFLYTSGFTSPEIYWPKYNQGDCLERQDFIMQIAPGGCSPAVVTSDLLEEQNVPVFCKIMSIQVNPLIDISRIRALRFTGDYPNGVSSVSYFPAKAALQSQQGLVSSPVKDNLGYLVVVLSRQKIESEMPEFVAGNITAVIDYDAEGAFGIGNTNFYVNELSDEEWFRNYKEYGFWNGKAYVKAESIDENQATISVYRDADSKQATVTLQKGETSKDIYLAGFYCAAGMNIKVEQIDAPVETALLQINDEQIWVARGDRILNGKCYVSDLNAYAGGGKVTVSCSVQNGRFDLSITPGKATLNNAEQQKDYAIGEKITGENIKDNIFLGYMGEDSEGTNFIVLINDTYSDTEIEFADKDIFSAVDSVINEKGKIDEIKTTIESAIKRQYEKKLTSLSSGDINKNIKIQILKKSESWNSIQLIDTLTSKDKNWDLEKDSQKILAKQYYEQAIENYRNLKDFYPNEKSTDEEDAYAARGLYLAAQLSKNFGMNEKASEFYGELIINYPDSDIASQAIRQKQLLIKYDASQSKAVVSMNNERFFFDLLDFKKPNTEDVNAVLLIDGKETRLGLDEIKVIEKESKKSTLQIQEIKDEYVILRHAKPGVDILGTNTQTQKILLDGQFVFDDINVKLLNINLKKQVKISINPKVFGPRTESNFSFKIGIEKRAIQISPEKTKSMINNIDNNIKTWNDVNEKLGEVVKGLKAACFATSAMLTAKTLVEGFSGESMARKQIMASSGGWNDFCEKEVNDKKYSSVEKCLLERNSDITKDISIYQKQIEETNNKLKKIQQDVGLTQSDPLDFQMQTDALNVEGNFSKEFNEFCSQQSGSIILSDKRATPVNIKDICSWDTTTFEQKKDIMTLLNLRNHAQAEGSSVLKDFTEKELGKITLDAKNYWEYQGAEIAAEKEAEDYGLKATRLAGEKTALAEIYAVKSGDKVSSENSKLNQGDKIVRVFIPKTVPNENYSALSEIANKYAILKLVKDADSNTYNLDKVYGINGQTSEEITADVKKYINLNQVTSFRESNAEAYENPMSHPENIKVEYFERAPYKGLPAMVPFDINKGWYVKMEYVLSGFGKPYDESGRAVNYYICNVGPNGIIEFKRSNDDICRYYNGNTADLNFPGISESQSRVLISQAQQSISEAARQYGQEKIRIGKNIFKSGISFGGEEGRCSDFMNPSDCNILFNVCDPVICPASRCDLGGKFRVDNVIQTGIIGSLMLCLPNYQEGIFVPICLSGVHAGVEGYVNILNSTQQCLNESLETGANVGICDEIKSIYLCEFFWKQATPFLNVAIPRIIESFFMQGVRGGGEYLTVQSAWDNTAAAVDYFKNEYAINSMQAFNARSTGEIGDSVCKSYMSVVYPNSENLFDTLIEPDSPVQYSSWFSEDILTTATIPSTSHYKVYYHIYSGKDQGSYFAVYLKDLPEQNYIYSSQTYVVGRGYIPRGSQVDEARDFTAVSGYKQLCISINGQDECGFGKVSTSYFLNAVSDAYAEEQIKSGIISEKECVAGTPSLYSLIQPDIQSGVEEIINPELYNSGIIRVCATQNPGKLTTPAGEYDTTASSYDRWKEVGYCDDKTIKCWLDTSSVKNVIQNKRIEQEVLDEVDLNIFDESGIMDENSSKTTAIKLKTAINEITIYSSDTESQISSKIKPIVDELEKLTNLGISNKYRAYGVYLLGELYRKVSESILNPEAEINPQSESPSDTKFVDDAGIKSIVEDSNTEPAPPLKPVEELFIYRIFGSDERYYFYTYEDGKWLFATSKTQSLLTYENDKEQYEEYVPFLGYNAETGFNKLKTMYKDRLESIRK